MSPRPTAESVTADTIDLINNLIAAIREILSDIATTERNDAKRSKRDRAISRWEIYLGVMLIKTAEGIVALAPSKNVRAMSILARSMFEYQQKAEYFLTHRKEAFEQYGSIGAREYAELSKIAHPDATVGVRLTTKYLEWKRTSGKRNEYSGNVALWNMHRQNTDASKIKTDKDGEEYTEEFQTAYGIPSLYVHGEPLLIPEVFSKLNDDRDWATREDTTYFDTVTGLGATFPHLINFAMKTTKAYGFDVKRVHRLSPHVQRVINTTAELHGSPRRLVYRPSAAGGKTKPSPPKPRH
jgi:hypothetical protein